MLQAVLHRVIIKADKFVESNPDYQKARSLGLEIPEMEDHKRAQAGVDTGTVVDVGPIAFRDFGAESPIQVGSRIGYARFGGKIVRDTDETEYVVLNDEDVIVVYKE